MGKGGVRVWGQSLQMYDVIQRFSLSLRILLRKRELVDGLHTVALNIQHMSAIY